MLISEIHHTLTFFACEINIGLFHFEEDFSFTKCVHLFASYYQGHAHIVHAREQSLCTVAIDIIVKRQKAVWQSLFRLVRHFSP